MPPRQKDPVDINRASLDPAQCAGHMPETILVSPQWATCLCGLS